MNTKLCVKVGKTPIETYEMLQTVCGDEASSRNCAFGLFKRFKDGREELQDDPRSDNRSGMVAVQGPNEALPYYIHTYIHPRSERPSTSRNAYTIANVLEIVIRDRRWASEMMTEELNINKKTILQILHEDLWNRKICPKFVPHRLTDEQKQRRLTSSKPVKTTPIFFIAFSLS
jgi:hypothetical protein